MQRLMLACLLPMAALAAELTPPPPAAQSTVQLVQQVLPPAAAINCPPGTRYKTEQKAEVREEWCEGEYQEHAALHGPYKAWWANGQLNAEGSYENGAMVGAWQYWNMAGKFEGALIYQEGERVSAAISRRK